MKRFLRRVGDVALFVVFYATLSMCVMMEAGGSAKAGYFLEFGLYAFGVILFLRMLSQWGLNRIYVRQLLAFREHLDPIKRLAASAASSILNDGTSSPNAVSKEVGEMAAIHRCDQRLIDHIIWWVEMLMFFALLVILVSYGYVFSALIFGIKVHHRWPQ